MLQNYSDKTKISNNSTLCQLTVMRLLSDQLVMPVLPRVISGKRLMQQAFCRFRWQFRFMMMVMEYLFQRNNKQKKEVSPKFLKDLKQKKINRESGFLKEKDGTIPV